MSVREYIGARYVPLFANPITWDPTQTYEALTVVLYQGNSYTSRQAVPANIDITNQTYWAQTGNYNAQVEQYRQVVQTFDNRITQNAEDIDTETVARQQADTALNTAIGNNAENIDAETITRQQADTALQTAINNEATARANADTALSEEISAITGQSYAIAIGNSWVSNETTNSYGYILSEWMQSQMDYTIKCYGRSGAGWLTPSPTNHLIEEAVTEAINNAVNPLDCEAIVLVEMQNDHALFTNTHTPSGYVEKIKQQIQRLKSVFKKASFYYVADCHGTSVTPTEYYNFCAMLKLNFSMQVLYTPFMFLAEGYLDEGHLANSVAGYGAFAKHIYRMIHGSEMHYPPVILNTANTNALKDCVVYTVGEPIDARNMKITVLATVIAQSNIPAEPEISLPHTTGINWGVMAYLGGGLLKDADSRSNNTHAPKSAIDVRTNGTIAIRNGSEVTSTISSNTQMRLFSANLSYLYTLLA